MAYAALRFGRHALALLCALVCGFARPALAKPPRGEDACAPASSGAPAQAMGLDEAGDIRLADGRVLVLAGLAPPDGETAALARAWLAARLAAGRLRVTPTEARPDRWGRWAARIARAEDHAVEGEPDDLAAGLVEAGLAMVMPGALDAACLRALLAREAAARAAARGLWGAGGALMADDPAAILARLGRYGVVEGRVQSVGVRATRVYLNFGTIWTEDFTVTVSKPNLRKFEASGMRWTALQGRRVRVRGLVVEQGGPMIEAGTPEEIERLD